MYPCSQSRSLGQSPAANFFSFSFSFSFSICIFVCTSTLRSLILCFLHCFHYTLATSKWATQIFLSILSWWSSQPTSISIFQFYPCLLTQLFISRVCIFILVCHACQPLLSFTFFIHCLVLVIMYSFLFTVFFSYCTVIVYYIPCYTVPYFFYFSISSRRKIEKEEAVSQDYIAYYAYTTPNPLLIRFTRIFYTGRPQNHGGPSAPVVPCTQIGLPGGVHTCPQSPSQVTCLSC